MSLSDAFHALHASGWSIGDARFLGPDGPVWHVSGTNGENRISAQGATQSEAWELAVEQARACGMFRNVAVGTGRF